MDSKSSSFEEIRVLEFFSGIGGWRCALDRVAAHPLSEPEPDSSNSSSPLRGSQGHGARRRKTFAVVESYDINTISNEVYEHNFKVKPSSKCITSLTKKTIDQHYASMWCMSPPCQPYTRNNTSAKRDANDQRSNAFLHLVYLLKEINHPPQYIALENVVGFESSDCCLRFLRTLSELQYSYIEFVLTPIQFGIPNSRPRYYLLAARRDPARSLPLPALWRSAAASSTVAEENTPRSDILHEIPALDDHKEEMCCDNIRKISEYLEAPSYEDDSLLVPPSVLSKPSSWCFDIVSPEDTHTACFTKAYSRYAKGTGSILASASWREGFVVATNTSPVTVCTSAATTISSPMKRPRLDCEDKTTGTGTGSQQADRCTADREQRSVEDGSSDESGAAKKCLSTDQIQNLRLRYFSPNELLRLFGFPQQSSYSFPDQLSNRKCFELIGNSLNVDIAAYLLRFLLRSDTS